MNASRVSDDQLMLNRDLKMFIDMISSDDETVQLDGVIRIRKLLASQKEDLTNQVTESGVVNTLLGFMDSNDNTDLQYESAWAITNICGGASEYVKYIIDLGALDVITKLLSSSHCNIVEQAVWAVGNIAGDGVYFRDICLEKGCMLLLLNAFDRFQENSNIKKTIVWAIYNLIRGPTTPQWDEISSGILLMSQIINKEDSCLEMLSDALWSIAHASKDYAQEILKMDCVPCLVQHLENENTSLIAPALRALGNILADDILATDAILDCTNFLPNIFNLTEHAKFTIRKDACWVISNIAAGNSAQIAKIIEDKNYINSLSALFIQDGEEEEVITHAFRAVSNLTLNATPQQIRKLMREYDYAGYLRKMLDVDNVEVQHLALEAISKVIQKAESIFDTIDYLRIFKSKSIDETVFRFTKEENRSLARSANEIFKLFKALQPSKRPDFEKFNCSRLHEKIEI